VLSVQATVTAFTWPVAAETVGSARLSGLDGWLLAVDVHAVATAVARHAAAVQHALTENLMASSLLPGD
jgi:hypothetical protein